MTLKTVAQTSSSLPEEDVELLGSDCLETVTDN